MTELEFVQRELHRIRLVWDEARAPFVKHLIMLDSFEPRRVIMALDGSLQIERIEVPGDAETKRLLYQQLDYINEQCLAQCKEFAKRHGVILV